MAGLQANWDFLSDFQQRGTLALDALRAQAAQSPWGVASNGRILDEPRLRSMEEMYLPDVEEIGIVEFLGEPSI